VLGEKENLIKFVRVSFVEEEGDYETTKTPYISQRKKYRVKGI
jgi:hypothetical protein